MMHTISAPRRATGLNENYARELLELHTLGFGGGYTQDDLVAVSPAFTGWTIDLRSGHFTFEPEAHDASPKVVLGWEITTEGISEGEQVLDLLARHPSTAHFISEKLARRFVNDEPPKALVDRAAAVFLESDGDMQEVVRTIITSPEFFSLEAYRDQSKDTVRMMYGEWPGLEPEQLYEGRDLALTTDFRDIFAEALAGQLGIEQLDRVFPSYQVDRASFMA